MITVITYILVYEFRFHFMLTLTLFANFVPNGGVSLSNLIVNYLIKRFIRMKTEFK
jgi:hypothetical protein